MTYTKLITLSSIATLVLAGCSGGDEARFEGGANNAPSIKTEEGITLDEDTTKNITIQGIDEDGDELTYIIVEQPSHGTLTGTGPDFTYTPNPDYNGEDSFVVKVNDGELDSEEETISIVISPINDAPKAVNISENINEDEVLNISPNVSDIDGDTLTYIITQQPTHGTLTGTGPDFTYTPNANYNGTDTFKYKVNDGTDNSNEATVSINISSINDAPIANTKKIVLDEDSSINITPTVSDSDGDSLTYTITQQPTHGILSGTGPDFTYTPNTNYNGSDSFKYKVNDGTVDSNEAQISINVNPVNDAPSANDSSISMNEDSTINIIPSASDIEGSQLSYIIATQPTNGVVSQTGSGFTYKPNENYHGIDSFTFKVNDGELNSNEARISITINSVNDAPVANNGSSSVDEDNNIIITPTVSDSDGDNLTYVITQQPSHGTLTGAGPNFTYTPEQNYNGSDSFKYKVNDGTTDSNEATISITVNSVNDKPIANDDTFSVDEDNNLAITPTVSDIENDQLTYVITQQPTHGTLTGTGPNFTYTPEQNYNGVDSFKYKVNDGTTDSNEATISITVNSVNDAPVANNGSSSVDEDNNIIITPTVSDSDGDNLTYVITQQPTHGSLTGAGPNFTYTPNANYNGSDSFKYKVNDGTTDSNEATISITVNSVNDAPVANDGSVSLDEDTNLLITADVSDVENDSLTYVITQQPAHGTLSGTGPDITYTPEENYNGTDIFKYKANDGTDDSNEATVSITINPVNDTPIANDSSENVNEDEFIVITANITDPDNDTLTYTITQQPSHGTLTGTGPDITYTPETNYNGPDSFKYQVNDGTTDSNEATVSINVISVNDIPETSGQNLEVYQAEKLDITLAGSDIDGDLLTYTITQQPTNGTLTGTGPNFTYKVNQNNTEETDSFSFVVNDGTDNSSEATVNIKIKRACIITVKTDVPGATASTSTQYKVSTNSSNYRVDCDSDGIDEATGISGDYICDYPSAGTYTISIRDNYTDFGVDTRSRDKNKLISVEQWGTSEWTTFKNAFYAYRNVKINATDIPNLSKVKDMSYAFASTSFITANFNDWDVSNVEDMSFLFADSGFNSPLDRWDVSNVINMDSLFRKTTRFNQNINSWDTINVKNMSNLFNTAAAFNQPLNNWDTSNVENMLGMFYNTPKFNQPLNNWNTSKVTDMSNMFGTTQMFNQDINSWDTSNVINMSEMFSNTYAFNQPLNNWDTSNVENMSSMFELARKFNQNINSWNVSKVTTMAAMFSNTYLFNQPLDNWDTSSVTNLSKTFSSTREFDQNIDNWNISNVTNISSLFQSAAKFNQPLNNWDTSKVTMMTYVFYNAPRFNQPLNNWNTSRVNNMAYMFYYASAFNQNISNWNTGNVVNMYYMFSYARAFSNNNLSRWNVYKVSDRHVNFSQGWGVGNREPNWIR